MIGDMKDDGVETRLTTDGNTVVVVVLSFDWTTTLDVLLATEKVKRPVSFTDNCDTGGVA